MPNRKQLRSGHDDLADALEDIARAARESKRALVQPYLVEVLEHRGFVSRDACDRLALTGAGEQFLKERWAARKRPAT